MYLALYGGIGTPRGPYTGKTPQVIVTKVKGAGGGRKRKGRWINIAGEHFKVFSAYEEQQLVQRWYEAKRAEFLEAKAGTEAKKAKHARISLTKAAKRLESATVQMELEREFKRIDRIKSDDELIILFLANL